MHFNKLASCLQPIMNRLFLSLFAVALFVPFARAATYTAASCSQAAVQAAINAELASAADGDVIAIPAGTCTWTGTTQVSGTFTHSVTMRGAGAISATTGGASTTGTDQTVIIDNVNHPGGPPSSLYIATTNGKSFRFTGVAMLQNASSSVQNDAILAFGGTSKTVRLDHCHFFMILSTHQVSFTGVLGVVDHVYVNTNSGNAGFYFEETWDGVDNGNGDGSWHDSDHWGSSNFMFIEDTRFEAPVSDAHDGARYVIRHSTISTPSNGQIFNHGVTDSRGRGVRAIEIYDNVFTNTGNNSNPTIGLNSGTLLYWGNNVTGGWGHGVELAYNFRNTAGGASYNYLAPPNGWGFCSAGAGGPTNWDGNTDSTGYPCLDQPGRGAGDLLSGGFPTACNQTLGCGTFTGQWPREALSPIYMWNNNFDPQYYVNNFMVGNGESQIVDNRDYYQQFAPTGESGTFNGTRGVGQGLLSARTSTCTAGPGGNTPGVGYWATDTNTLYVCNPTNTWTVYYTPYTYPHPLTSAVLPPTNLRAIVH